MSIERMSDVAVTVFFCALALISSNELIRVAAIFAAGWHASWAIQGETR